MSDHILAGSLDNFKGDDAIAVGVGLARRFALNVGSDLTLISPQGAATAFGTVPRVRAYKVVAIFQVGENEYDSGYVFLPLAAAQVYFQKPDVATQLEVMVSDPERVGSVHRAIFDALRGQVQVMDWQQSNNSFFAAVQVETECHVPDPDADHPGGGVQCDQLADHDGEGQDAAISRCCAPWEPAAAR